MIKVKELTKTFNGFTALNKLNLSVNKGSIYGLVGVNGSGKTTIIKHLTGIYFQDSGEALVDGKPVYDNADIKRRTGFVPDDLYFFPSYSIDALAKFYAAMYPAWNGERYKGLLKSFGLDGARKLNKLSKGLQKQAMFSLVLSISPDALILDEPVDGLDPIVRRRVMSAVMEDVESRGMTVLISSHNLKEMEGVCDSVGIMKKGRMIIERGLDDLKTDVHKIQLAFAPGAENNIDGLNILRHEKIGSVEFLVVRGKETEITDRLKSLRPVLMDIVPLTLEEIFMYETEQEVETND